MEWDEAKAKPGMRVTIGEDLSNLSVRELADRIDALKAEISRAEQVLEGKRKHNAAADELFGKT